MTERRGKLRLLFCSDALLVDGVTSYILHLGTALVREGYEVAVLGRWAGRGFQKRYRHEGMKVFSCPSFTVGNAWFDRQAKKFDPHIILTDSRRSFPLATRLKKITGKPVITYFLDHLEKTDRPGRDVASLMRWSDGWAVAEEPIKQSLQKIAPEFPVFTLPRPLDVVVPSLPLPSRDPFRILCFGRLSGYKTPGMFKLIENACVLDRIIPNVEIVVVGGGGWRLLSFQRKARKINQVLGRSCVHIAGTQIDVRPWLEKASLICGGSTSAIEGALANRPVVCFTGYWFGLVTPHNLQDAFGCYFGERGGKHLFSDPGVSELIVPEILKVYNDYESVSQNILSIAKELKKHFDSQDTLKAFENILAFLGNS